MKKIKTDKLIKRIIMCIVGVVVGGLSVGLFKRAAFGVDPFQSFMAGLDALIPISFGTLYVIANAVLLLFSLFADRHYIGIATVINLFLVGYVTEFSYNTLMHFFPVLGITGRIVCLLIGIVILCLASSLYFTADLGVSTYDAVALIITKTWKIGKFKFVRIITDLICVITGIVLYLISGGKAKGIYAFVGAGTIITAFFMGPLIDVFNRYVASPLLNGKKSAKSS